MSDDILCIKCQKKVATGENIKGITTWFAVCSECLYGVKGHSNETVNEGEEKIMSKYICDICDTENNVGGNCPNCNQPMKCTICGGEFGGYYCDNPKMKSYSDLDCPDYENFGEKYGECTPCPHWKKCDCSTEE